MEIPLEHYRQAWVCQLVYSAKADMIAVVRRIRPAMSHESGGPYVTFMPLEGGSISWAHDRFLQGFQRIADNGESRADAFWNYDDIGRSDPYFKILEQRGRQYVKNPGSDTASLADLLDAVGRGESVRKHPQKPDDAARNIPNPPSWVF